MNSRLFHFLFAALTLTANGQQQPVYSDAEAGGHVGETAIVTGKVFTVSISGKGATFLNLGDHYPRQVFSAIIFASDRDAVGDVKQYEGKIVALTGVIERSPDQKPRIVLRGADQIKLASIPADSAPPVPTPAPATTPVPTPVAPTMEPPPSTPKEASISETPARKIGRIGLPVGWNSPRRGGETVRKDLARLFGDHGAASEDAVVDVTLEIYPGIHFLMPLAAARSELKIARQQATRTKLNTPGFPSDTFYAHEISGIFPGGYNRIFLITDTDDQVVSILLVDSSIRARVPNEPDTTGYHTYNFITGSGKGVPFLAIRHKVTPAATPGSTFTVDTLLIDPTDPETPAQSRPKKSTRSSAASKPKTGKVLERSRWFIPPPMVNLILRCVGSG